MIATMSPVTFAALIVLSCPVASLRMQKEQLPIVTLLPLDGDSDDSFGSSTDMALHRGPSDEEKAKGRVVFKKFTKTASLLLRQIVNEVLRVNVTEIGETTLLVADMKKKYGGRNLDRVSNPLENFVIASIRNPCNWLLSLWSFASSGEGGWRKQCNRTTHGPYSSTYDKKVFAQWVRAHPGLVTTRFAHAYAVKDPWRNNYYCHWKLEQRDREALEDVDLSFIDCMVETESFATDTRACMKKAETRGLKVDWDQLELLLQRHPHATKHGSCTEYFDEDLQGFVMREEDVTFRKFNFETCCAAPH